jgi:hypothetical protein
MFAAAPTKLELPDNQAIRVYAEIYNVGRRDSTVRYTATYVFERLDGFIIRRRRESVSTFSFQRESPWRPRLIESLVVDPDLLPAGQYRLRLEITKEGGNEEPATTVIEFRLR